MAIPEYLYHYYEIDNGPFRNITENEPQKAIEIQDQISIGFNSKRPSNYIELRFDLEKRLKEGFISKGGIPNRDDPFYFTLGACEWMKSCYSNPGAIKIPLAALKPEHISFTYPDSMVSFQFYDEPKLGKFRKEFNGKVFLLDEIKELIGKHGLPSEDKWKFQEEMKYDRYIEAQLWDDTLIKAYQNKAL